MPCRATQDGWVTVKSSDKAGPTGGGHGNPLQYSCHENPLLVVVVYLLSCVRLLRPHGRYPARLLCPRDSPGKNTGVGCHFLLQRIFPTQESNTCLLWLWHCRWILNHGASREAPENPMDSMSKAKAYNTRRWAHPIRKCPTCSWAKAVEGNYLQLQKEWSSWAKVEMTLSCGCVWWWKKSLML